MALAEMTRSLAGTRLRLVLPAFAGALFLSAFLLFAVQPLFTKMVLPILGGAPAVWSVAMVFFQGMLLAGYAYAHLLARHLGTRNAALVHLGVMALALVSLPVSLASFAQNPPETGEALWLLGLFGASVGLPFFAVSANGPLLQAWFARSGHAHARDPYFLYGASNIGSFAALLAYPFLIEPFSRLQAQTGAWTAGFVVLGLMIAGCAFLVIRNGALAGQEDQSVQTAAPSWRERGLWIVLSAVPSGLLVAVTAHISTDVAAAPLLWVVPLALFLLTFVLVFRDRPVIAPRVLRLAQLGLTMLVIALMAMGGGTLALSLPAHLALFFVNAMVCHSALYARRPAAGRLTDFYLMMSLGGVIGGIFCGLIAPHVFSSVAEYPILLAAALACGMLGDRRGVLIGLAAALILAVLPVLAQRNTSIRSFFGVHKIGTYLDGQYRILAHGTTLHGAMRLADKDGNPVTGRPEPTTYYTTDGGLAEAVRSVRGAQGGIIQRSFVVGLGAGVMNCHFRSDERLTFFEIDPEVVRIASNRAMFRFLSDCEGRPDMRIGDARLTLTRESERASLIVIDAFSSDAIPLHLLTRQAIETYANRLTENGALVFHISNKYFALSRILSRTAAEADFETYLRLDAGFDEPYETRLRAPSLVAVMVRKGADAGALANDGARWIKAPPDASVQPWTDDYSNILAAMRDKVLGLDLSGLSPSTP